MEQEACDLVPPNHAEHHEWIEGQIAAGKKRAERAEDFRWNLYAFMMRGAILTIAGGLVLGLVTWLAHQLGSSV